MAVSRLPVAFPGPTKSITAWPAIISDEAQYVFTFFFFLRVMSLFLKDVFQRNKGFECEAGVWLFLMSPV